MTPAQEGAYIRLLAYAWNEPDCGLSDDDEQLAILSRLGEGWFKGGGAVVRECFFEKDGRLYNKRLLKERKKQEEWKRKSSEGGKMSAKARWGKGKGGDKGGYKMVTTKGQPKGNPSSSSSSSNTSTKKRKNIKKESSDFFDIFWKTHPGTKTGKKKCLEKWKVINPDQVLFDRIIKALQEQTAWRARAKPGEFRPEWKNPLTWLNQECWNDEVGPEKKKEGNYQPYVCGNCNHGFKLNVDLDENCCPNCGMFIRKKQPAKDSPVGKMVGKLAKKFSMPQETK